MAAAAADGQHRHLAAGLGGQPAGSAASSGPTGSGPGHQESLPDQALTRILTGLLPGVTEAAARDREAYSRMAPGST